VGGGIYTLELLGVTAGGAMLELLGVTTGEAVLELLGAMPLELETVITLGLL
jgi:hypothetical protein